MDLGRDIFTDKDKIEKVVIVIPTALKAIDGGDTIALNKLLHSFNEFVDAPGFAFSFLISIHERNRSQVEILIKPFEIFFDFKLFVYDYSFNFSKVMNDSVELLSEEYIIFCNDDLEFFTKIDLTCFLNHLRVPEIGSVGAKLYNTDLNIIHFGIEYFDGFPRHFLNNFDPTQMVPSHIYCREISGSTAAFLGIRRKIFTQIGFFDEAFPLEYNDVDLMIRLTKANLYNVVCAKTKIIHRESLTRIKGINETEYLKILENKHGKLPDRDPFLFTPKL